VLILTQHEDRQYVLPLLQAGAMGYVLKRALGADLITAVRTVARGEMFLYGPAAEIKAEFERCRAETTDSRSKHLTPREQQILKHIVAGETNPQIALILGISAKTVEWHRGNLMNKLGAHTVADLVRQAMQEGLVQLSM
jgi:DNA-binding NarL/FixJ family response regulator